MAIVATSSLLDIATHLGTQAGEAADPWAVDDLRQAADYLRACRRDGISPERDAYGISDEMGELIDLADALGMGEDDIGALRRAYSAAAHDAEDCQIIDLVDEIESATDLIDIDTGDIIREATMDERWESAIAARRDGGRGAISAAGQTCYAG